MENKIDLKSVVLCIVLVLILASGALFMLGRTPICECGYVKLWHGETVSSENSQHIFDPYTFTHIIHGFLFYLLLRIFAKRVESRKRLIIAVLLNLFGKFLKIPILLFRDTGRYFGINHRIYFRAEIFGLGVVCGIYNY